MSLARDTSLSASRTDIWVVTGSWDGAGKEVIAELLGEARRLASSNGSVCVLLLRDDVEEQAAHLGQSGADRVLAIRELGRLLPAYHPEVVADVVARTIAAHAPLLVLFPGTVLGHDVGTRVALRMECRFLQSCVNFEIDAGGRLRATRPVRARRLYASELCDSPPYLASLIPDTVGVGSTDAPRSAPIEWLELAPLNAEQQIEALAFLPGDPRVLDLAEAEVIVAGGRGIGGPEGFGLLQELADELGASLGASRPAVDAGWVDYARLVGQSGKSVRPKLYIACGISGATQHLAGIRDADCVIAINNDSAAQIFSSATLAVEGDVHTILPFLLSLLRRRSAVSIPEGS